jgi:predicted glycosyltransferase involved in capsule biosynthesis
MRKYALTFIIPYKHSNDRLNNLKRVINWLKGFNNIEIILVEQDRTPKVNYIDFGCKYYFVKNEKLPFNKAWSFNVGLKYATSDIIAFGDSDLVMHPEKFIEAVKELTSTDLEMVSPYSRLKVIDLEPAEVRLSFDDLENIDRPGRGELENDIRKVPLCGGICIFKRDAIYKIGGWSEDFIGWGGEDDFQSNKVERFLKYKEMPSRVYHLHHAPVVPDTQYYHRNLDILNKLKALDDNQMIGYINRTVGKIGMNNKYEI